MKINIKKKREIMIEECGDNRSEIIRKAKEQLIECTNIETSPEEMKVLDNFLFRCWQMGWLNEYSLEKEEDVPEHSFVNYSAAKDS